ncbi:MAG: NlpC/P60 family protein [Micrococcaceae bacterium]
MKKLTKVIATTVPFISAAAIGAPAANAAPISQPYNWSTTNGNTSNYGTSNTATTATTTGTTSNTQSVSVNSTSTTSSSNAATVAASYVGSDYYSVGTCTGFTSLVFNQIGIALPTGWPADQANWALANGATATSTPSVGDLVIQSDGGTGEAHAGIYAGDGMMYAATNPSQGVILQPVSWGSGTVYYHF